MPIRPELDQEFDQSVAGMRGKHRGRLVENDEFRFDDQSAGDIDALKRRCAEIARLAIEQSGIESHHLEIARRLLALVCLAQGRMDSNGSERMSAIVQRGLTLSKGS